MFAISEQIPGENIGAQGTAAQETFDISKQFPAPKPETKKRLILFIVFAMGIGWAMMSLIPLSGLTYGEGAATAILAATMFVPALSSLLARLLTKEGFQNMYLHPHFKGHFKDYLLVFLGPTLLLFLSGAVYFLIFPHTFDSGLTGLEALLAARGPAGVTPLQILLFTILQIIIIGPLINIIPTLGEELGWRGYLLPKLREFYTDRTALVAAGAIWGFWHWPVIVMGHNYGKDYVGYPGLGILAMIAFCVVLGIIEGYATIKLESVIPAAMIHSTVNAGAALPILLVKGGYNNLLGPAITGLFGGIPFIIVAAVLYIKAVIFRVSST